MENVKQILFVNACMRGPERSRTWKLCQTFLKACKNRWPEAEIRERDLTASPLPVLTTELDDRRHQRFPENPRDPMFDPAHEVAQADLVVIGAPYWDLTFPAALRTYIEYISANGLTYHYEVDGCHGDCRAEKLVYLTSGGDVERSERLGVLYWKQLSAMFGIPAFDHVFAGGLDLDPARTAEILAEACEKAHRLAEDF